MFVNKVGYIRCSYLLISFLASLILLVHYCAEVLKTRMPQLLCSLIFRFTVCCFSLHVFLYINFKNKLYSNFHATVWTISSIIIYTRSGDTDKTVSTCADKNKMFLASDVISLNVVVNLLSLASYQQDTYYPRNCLFNCNSL